MGNEKPVRKEGVKLWGGGGSKMIPPRLKREVLQRDDVKRKCPLAGRSKKRKVNIKK